MATDSYQPPVSALLTYGSCLELDKKFDDPERDSEAPLTKGLARRSQKERMRVSMTESLERIAKTHPELQERCATTLANQLKDYVRNPKSLNGFLVSSLIELEGNDYAELMAEAYNAERVDVTICGTWANVQIDMGLATEADFSPEALELPKPEWAIPPEPTKPSTRDLGLPTKRPDDELSIVFGDGKLPFSKQKATKSSKGFGGGKDKQAKKKKKKKEINNNLLRQMLKQENQLSQGDRQAEG